MEDLDALTTTKIYKYFQLMGRSDGTLVGQISLNGTVLHELEGEPASVSHNGAQQALQFGENILRFEISGAKESQDEFDEPILEYAILGAAADEDGDPFTSDHIIDVTEDLSGVTTFPWVRDYRFALDTESYSVLKR